MYAAAVDEGHEPLDTVQTKEFTPAESCDTWVVWLEETPIDADPLSSDQAPVPTEGWAAESVATEAQTV